MLGSTSIVLSCIECDHSGRRDFQAEGFLRIEILFSCCQLGNSLAKFAYISPLYCAPYFALQHLDAVEPAQAMMNFMQK